MKDVTPENSWRSFFERPRVRRGESKPKLSEDLTGLSLVVGVLVVFLATTFMAARLIAYFLSARTIGAIFAIWVVTTLLGIVFVRQIPSLTDRGGDGLLH